MKLNLKKASKDAKVKSKKVAKAAEESVTKKSKAVDAMAKKGATKKPPTFTWKAPDTLGSSFPVEVTFVTERDGMPGGRWRALRIKGRYPTEDERKIFDLSVTDPVTYAALISRLSLVLFHPTGRLNSKGQSPRLQPKTQYKVLLRCSRRKADDNIVSRISKVWIVEKNKKGKVVDRELDKKDLDQRKIKKINKHLPAAFLRLAELPEVRKRRKSDEDDDE